MAISKTYYSGNDASVGFASPESYTNKRYKSGVQAANDFIQSMPDSPTKTRLVRTWDDYNELRNACELAAGIIIKRKQFAEKLLSTVFNFTEGLYREQKNAKNLLLAVCNKGWQNIDNAISNCDLPITDFGSALAEAHAEWETLDVTQEDFSSNEHYQSMVSCLTSSLEELNKIYTEPVDVNETSLFKMFIQIMKDLSMCGFRGDFIWESPSALANQSDTLSPDNNATLTNTEIVGNGVKASAEVNTPQSKFTLNDIPNYHLALQEAPRKCSSCRFFLTDSNRCDIYKLDVNPKYVCDIWQAKELTSTHTVVRNATKTKIERVGDYPTIQGNVQAQVAIPTPLVNQQVYNETVTGYNNPVNITAGKDRMFLPNDIVYSKLHKKICRVISTVTDSNNIIQYVVVSVTNGSNISEMMAYVNVDDLELRTNTAMRVGGGSKLPDGFDVKTLEPKKTKNVKDGEANLAATAGSTLENLSEKDINEMVEGVRNMYKETQNVYKKCKSGDSVLTQTNDLNPLINTMKAELNKDVYKSAATGPKRKYYRAIENACWSVGAARNILFQGQKEALRLINNGEKEKDAAKVLGYKKEADRVAKYHHNEAVKLIGNALKQLEMALTKPSATHGLEPAGLGVADGSAKSMKADTSSGEYFTKNIV